MGENFERSIALGCTGVLLCGGKSRRMGFDKAFLQMDGEYLLLRHARKLEALFGRVLAVCERPAKLAAVPLLAALPQAADHYPETGPLGGVCTAFEETESPWLFVMACDMPSFDENILFSMLELIQNVDVVLCRNGERLEPLFAFYHRRCLPVFQKQLAKGELQLQSGFSQLRVAALPTQAGTAAFANLNTPGELAAWRRREGGPGGHGESEGAAGPAPDGAGGGLWPE